MANYLYDHLFAPHADNKACFIKLNNATRISFADFIELGAQIAHALQLAELSPGDRVLVQAEKSVAMLGLYAATIQAGGVFLPMNTAYTKDELAYFISDARPRLIVCASNSAGTLSPMAEAVGATILTLNADGQGSLMSTAAGMARQFTPVVRSENDIASLLYTSGTTGRSKGAMLSHANLLSNAQALRAHWQITEHDTLIHALPIFHIHGLFVALNTSLLAGACVHLLAKFNVEAILKAMPEATMLMGVPTFYTRLLADRRLTRELTANMRLFISGSAPLLAETHNEFTARTGHNILERYGMTETNMNSSNPYSGERRAGTVGLPLPGVEVVITDPETGAELPQGEIGMIEVRGPNVFQGYWQMPDKTATELRPNGFFITGDLGQYSDDGYLSIIGRSKDLIITGGYNVYPKEVEDVLNSIAGVAESAVFGIPDSDYGEAVIAALVMQTGVVTPIEQISQVVKARLARFKHPREYKILSELPRNTMGKVQKNVLRAECTKAAKRSL